MEASEHFRGLFACAEYAQIIHLPPHGCLAEIQRITEKGKMTLTEKRRDKANNQNHQQPG